MLTILRLHNIKHLCILVPFVYYTLNAQFFIALYVSDTLSQLGAYLMLALGLAGYFLILLTEEREAKPVLIHLWRLFFLIYFTIGFVANAIHHYYTPPFLKTLIPFFFFLAFTEYLCKHNRTAVFLNTALITFMLANIILIIFQQINFDVDHTGVYEYELNRAGGVHGDANNAALVCLITFILLYNYWKPRKFFGRLFRFLAFGITLFAIFLAFSKTGMVILLLILFIQQFKEINLKRIVVLFLVLPLVLFFVVQFGLNSDMLSDVQKIRLQNVINIITFNVDKVDSSHRDDLLINMLHFIFENPFLGNGLYFSTEIRGHNTIFGVWADSGILAFLVFLTLLIFYVHKAVSLPPSKRVFALSLMAVLFIYMLTLQTVINQPYLIGIFVFLCFFVSKPSSEMLEFSSQTK